MSLFCSAQISYSPNSKVISRISEKRVITFRGSYFLVLEFLSTFNQLKPFSNYSFDKHISLIFFFFGYLVKEDRRVNERTISVFFRWNTKLKKNLQSTFHNSSYGISYCYCAKL